MSNNTYFNSFNNLGDLWEQAQELWLTEQELEGFQTLEMLSANVTTILDPMGLS